MNTTFHPPYSSRGKELLNSFGVVVATCIHATAATDLAEALNSVIGSNNAEDPTDPEPITTFCPICDAENGPMGQLGNLVHYRCRQCGMDYNQESINV